MTWPLGLVSLIFNLSIIFDNRDLDAYCYVYNMAHVFLSIIFNQVDSIVYHIICDSVSVIIWPYMMINC